MKAQEKDRIESAIRHIQTAVDVDPWAVVIAVEAMEKQIETSLSDQSESKWIPCHPSELPTDKVLWVTYDNGWCRYVEKVFWDMTEWSRNVSDVVAYMPYEEPEPYIGEET